MLRSSYPRLGTTATANIFHDAGELWKIITRTEAFANAGVYTTLFRYNRNTPLTWSDESSFRRGMKVFFPPPADLTSINYHRTASMPETLEIDGIQSISLMDWIVLSIVTFLHRCVYTNRQQKFSRKWNFHRALCFYFCSCARTGAGRALPFYSENPFPARATNIPVTIERNILHKFLRHYRAFAFANLSSALNLVISPYILMVLLSHPPLAACRNCGGLTRNKSTGNIGKTVRGENLSEATNFRVKRLIRAEKLKVSFT